MPAVVAEADRHRLSNNALNDVLTTVMRGSGGDVNHFVLSKASTLMGRQNVRDLEVKNIKETFKKDIGSEFLTIHRDEKMLEESGDMEQTPHLVVLASHGNQSKLLGTTSLDRGTGL